MKTTITPPLLLACAMASAQTTTPPSQPFDAQTWSASMKQKPTLGATLGKWRVDFERTTLPEVLSRTSVGEIQHAGDAGESIYWLCYTLTGQTPARLWITSHGEMGGPEKAITGITITRLNSSPPLPECPALPIHMQPASLQAKVWLGMDGRTLASKLGAPSHRSGDWISYDFQGKAPGNCPGGSDVLNSLLLKTRRGTVEAIYANQITSC